MVDSKVIVSDIRSQFFSILITKPLRRFRELELCYDSITENTFTFGLHENLNSRVSYRPVNIK